MAETLVRAGVGHVTIVDRDYVEWSNLRRQRLFTEQDAIDRLPKAVAAAKRLSAINSDGIVDGIVMDVRAQELAVLSQGVDLMMDATDNFGTRLILNDIDLSMESRGFTEARRKFRHELHILPGETPCLNCLLGTIPWAATPATLTEFFRKRYRWSLPIKRWKR